MRSRTNSGGIIAVLSVISMVILFILRFQAWTNSPLTQKFVVNTPQLPFINNRIIDTEHLPKMDINFDIMMKHIPCSYLHVDVIDNIKESDESYEGHVRMERFDEKGNPILKKSYPKNSSVTKDPGYCGNCYGQKSGCCNTCKEVRKAFKANNRPPPPIIHIQQCVDEGYKEELIAMKGEACRVHGTLTVHRAPGTFHVAPGESYNINGEHDHYYEDLGINIDEMNFSHTINHFSIGMPTANSYYPLDGHTEIQQKTGRMKMIYFLRAVPINLDGRVFSFGASSYQNYRGSNSTKYPGVFFSYDVSLIGIVSSQNSSLMDLVTELMSILGGVFAIATFLDMLSYRLYPDDYLPKIE
ncbi:MGC83277 protein, putative [Trichomonas vaginalis G3]|uniref:MGC83277 protein, putative n=1 Tax=Trichomonas vaginalis (strain ATCC PRA-98 / G3) TaxID=412133 RepID=A2FD91_TRIV3|nr:vesicle-mediated transport [Trichomonas vaginalis G3]EAX97147.1 MGC83277 protein, putative [Trichomonas vaginalis G3]KAI5549217.1 vesicle-mediated transport [Trichomonas vaginalis G3]|eukprot:XP_001310077.1 MGC83277 protein [Trichomonas vaginalis G3]